MLHSMTITLIYVHLLEPFNLCQMPTRGDLGPNFDFHVNCNISFVLYYKIFRQDLCRFNDTTALVVPVSKKNVLRIELSPWLPHDCGTFYLWVSRMPQVNSHSNQCSRIIFFLDCFPFVFCISYVINFMLLLLLKTLFIATNNNINKPLKLNSRPHPAEPMFSQCPRGLS